LLKLENDLKKIAASILFKVHFLECYFNLFAKIFKIS